MDIQQVFALSLSLFPPPSLPPSLSPSLSLSTDMLFQARTALKAFTNATRFPCIHTTVIRVCSECVCGCACTCACERVCACVCVCVCVYLRLIRCSHQCCSDWILFVCVCVCVC